MVETQVRYGAWVYVILVLLLNVSSSWYDCHRGIGILSAFIGTSSAGVYSVHVLLCYHYSAAATTMFNCVSTMTIGCYTCSCIICMRGSAVPHACDYNGDLVFPCYSASSFACFRTVMEIFAWHYQGRYLQVLVMCLRLMSNEPISDLGELVHG